MNEPDTPEPRAWLVEIDGERWLHYDSKGYTEVEDPIEASTFESRDTAELAALDHLKEDITRARIAPLY